MVFRLGIPQSTSTSMSRNIGMITLHRSRGLDTFFTGIRPTSAPVRKVWESIMQAIITCYGPSYTSYKYYGNPISGFMPV